MDETIKAMIEALKQYGAGFISVSVGEYTIMITDDKDGAEFLKTAWDRYVDCDDVEEQYENRRRMSIFNTM